MDSWRNPAWMQVQVGCVLAGIAFAAIVLIEYAASRERRREGFDHYGFIARMLKHRFAEQNPETHAETTGAQRAQIRKRRFVRAGAYVMWLTALTYAIAAYVAISNLREADSYYMAGHYVNSVTRYRKALYAAPWSPLLHYHLALALAASGRPEEAMLEFHRALELDPKLSRAAVDLGNMYYFAGNYTQAIANYKLAGRVNKQDVAICLNLGMTYKNLGDLDAAAGAFRDALKLAPSLVEGHTDLADVLVLKGTRATTDAKLRKSSYDAAYREYQTALRIAPASIVAHLNYGSALKDMGQFDLARAQFEQAVELDEESEVTHNALGALLYVTHHVPEAVMQFERCTQIKRDFAYGFFNLGRALETEGQRAGAVSAYESYLRIVRSKPQYNGGVKLAEESLVRLRRP